ncbi:MAG: hypothetical protein ACRET2_14795 [Steroidobacteraceae bacterium]
MAFAERELRFTFTGASGAPRYLQASGLRSVANIQMYEGPIGVTAQVRVWGLTMAQMSRFSSKLTDAVGVDEYFLTIEAGDIGGQLTAIIAGSPIWRSYVDLSGAPESAFVVVCSGISRNAAMLAATYVQGSANAEDMIAAVCAGAGAMLINNGAHAVVRNMHTYGSLTDQITTLAHSAKFRFKIEGSTVWIWPHDGKPDKVVIDVGPAMTSDGSKPIGNLVGYPTFYPSGIIVRTLFDTRFRVGRSINISGSAATKANGSWKITQVEHELATMLHNGPWFTTIWAAPAGSSAS